MSGPAELKVYRASFPSVAPAWPCAATFFGIGVGITASARQSYPVMNVVIGTLVILVSLWMSATLATNRLIVTQAGLVYWNYLRRRFIGWAEVRSFGVGPSRSRMGWPGLAIHRNDASVLVTNVVAFSATYPARIAEELATWQGQLAPSAHASEGLTQAESLVPPGNAIVGIDLASSKQAAVVTDHDSRVLARRRVVARAWELGELLDWALASRSISCGGSR